MERHEMLLLHRMLTSATHPLQAAERAPRLLETWLRHAPESRPEERDWEDWAENASMLHALATHGEVILLPEDSRYRPFGSHSIMVQPQPNAPKAVMWGMFRFEDSLSFPIAADLRWNGASAVNRVMDYPSSPVFQTRVGRAFHVCDMDHGQVRQALLDIHATGARRGFYKTRSKGPTHAFDMGEDSASLWNDFDPENDIAWDIVNKEGMRGEIYLQAAFRPTREYRMVVVGRKVVCGAGCIEAYTPLDSVGNVFDDRVEVRRNDGKVIVDIRTVDEYVSFARRYAREWADAHGDDTAYSLDLSLDAETGDVIPIEMNPLQNLGLYANRPDLIVEAMLEEAKVQA